MLLNVYEAGPEQGHDDLPPVVFLHGLFGRGRNFGFFQRRLSTTRRTLALDLRNHGSSPHGPMDYPTLARDVHETLDHHNASRAVVIGHSMGGKTAMMLALHYPQSVDRLLVADIAPGEGGFAQSGSLAHDLAALKIPEYLDRAKADALLSQVIKEKPVRELMLQNMVLGEHAGWQIGLNEIVASMTAILGWPHIPEGECWPGKTLFVAGGNSRYIQPDNYPEMKRLFPAYELKTIEGAGHWVHAEKPNEFLEILEKFLA